jgi:hypothetical protein
MRTVGPKAEDIGISGFSFIENVDSLLDKAKSTPVMAIHFKCCYYYPHQNYDLIIYLIPDSQISDNSDLKKVLISL